LFPAHSRRLYRRSAQAPSGIYLISHVFWASVIKFFEYVNRLWDVLILLRDAKVVIDWPALGAISQNVYLNMLNFVHFY
jgi:hypothetical protein